MSEISRRGFLKGSLASAALGAAMLNGMSFATETQGAEAPQASESLETDILIVGCGAAGIFAAYEAGVAQAGKVLVISNSPTSVMTNGSMVSGTCAVETRLTQEIGQSYTSQQLFEKMYEFSHYTVDANLLRECVNYFPGNVEIFEKLGIEFSLGGDRAGLGFLNVHLFGTPDKNAIIQSYLEENYGVEFRFETEAYAPIMEEEKVGGVYARDAEGNVIEIKAKATVLCCGGFLSDAEQMKARFGNDVVPFSTPYQTGLGISIAEQAGAYREAQIGLGLTDIVAATEKVGFTFTNPLLMAGFYGNLLVNHLGQRFTNEFELANESMSVGGEALLHVKKYYAIYSQKTIDDLKTMGYYQHIGEPACWPTGALLYTSPMEGIEDMLNEAIELGWVFKADTIAELAQMEGLPHLEETVAAYDEMVASGVDGQFGKPIEMAEAIGQEGPFYLMQFNAGAFNTFGGCRTDEKTRALTADFDVIPGLYIAGVENGSLYSRPYYNVGGTCSGLAYSSGRIAGQQAAEYVKSL